MKTMMNLKKKLQNPMVLVAQGFVAGAILFHATQPPETAPAQPQPSASPALEKIVKA
jgi:H+/gluconate symporter-like permease